MILQLADIQRQLSMLTLHSKEDNKIVINGRNEAILLIDKQLAMKRASHETQSVATRKYLLFLPIHFLFYYFCTPYFII